MAEQRGAGAAPPEAPDMAGGRTAAEPLGPAAHPPDHAGRLRAIAIAKKSPRAVRASIYVNLVNVWPRRAVAARGEVR
jgi:hypothetical protein